MGSTKLILSELSRVLGKSFVFCCQLQTFEVDVGAVSRSALSKKSVDSRGTRDSRRALIRIPTSFWPRTFYKEIAYRSTLYLTLRHVRSRGFCGSLPSSVVMLYAIRDNYF
jgi:hypothetical protein